MVAQFEGEGLSNGSGELRYKKYPLPETTPEGVVGGALGLPAGWTKAAIDEAARAAGFAAADYPYYSPKNGCGPDGWRNHLVPDLSHILYGCDFSGACDGHDADYMTVGMPRERADERFRLELHAAVVRYVERTRAELAEAEQAEREIRGVGDAARRVVQVIGQTESVMGSAESNFVWRWWGWTAGTLAARREVMGVCGQGWDAVWSAGKAAVRASTLSDTQVDFMHWEADLYYEAVRRFGGGRFEVVQDSQARYEAWLREFLASH